MKKSSLKLSTIALVLIMGMIILVSPSCKSTTVTPTVQRSDTTSFIQKNAQIDTIYLHDSIYIRERQKGDTVYRDRIEYRDRWRVRLVHDTVIKTDSIVQVIEHPPERYIPPFYKRCTLLFWSVIGLFFLYIVLRITKSKLHL